KKTPQQPPPLVTQDQTQTVNGIAVTIKKDETNPSGLKDGEGDCSWQVDPGNTPGIEHDGPEDETKVNKQKKKITVISGTLPVITVKIMTRYKSKDSPTGMSAYGRGTTPQDKQDGNTSLGFHESCHRQDYLNFLGSNKVPMFGGKVGQTIAQWEKAVSDYNQ